MDIDLLAKMVKEAILDHEAVTLPGVGSFVAELMPSTFSDKGYTIHPPYRRLYFSPRQGSDTLLVDLYTAANAAEGVDTETATRILTEFLAEMKEVLKVRKTVVFPGLGRLRATRENHFFFVADEDLDIYPAGLGLAPVSLKTHVETPDEVASAVAGLAELMAEPEPEVQEIPGQAGNDEEEVVAGNDVTEPKVGNDVSQPEPEPVPELEVVEEIPGQAGNDGEEVVAGNDVTEPKVGNDVPQPEPEPVPEPEVVEEIPGQAGNDGEEVVAGNDVTEQEAGNDRKAAEEEISPRAAIGRNDNDKSVKVRTSKTKHTTAAQLKARKKKVTALLIALGVLLFLVLAYVLIGRLAPEVLDPLLYSPEELEILRY